MDQRRRMSTNPNNGDDWRILEGDCRDVLRTLGDASVDSVVTDPPYELGFMGKSWDSSGIAYDPELWGEVLRVLKPGGHLLSFGGSRTYHRMACAIEDAGFEVRDQIMWVYGTGFPKSRNLDGDGAGWGTALKPAHEPIVVARKPLAGTVAATVDKYGTGALNIDGCRIENNGGQAARPSHEGSSEHRYTDNGGTNFAMKPGPRGGSVKGRWPANLILDEAAAAVLDAQSGISRSTAAAGVRRHGRSGGIMGSVGELRDGRPEGHDDSGGASRFFYVAKPSRKERDAGLEDHNEHTTVKPIKLMRYLVRLVTPPEGIVLDPFAGSGTTGIAATAEGFRFVGIEREAEYAELARRRIDHWHEA
jgi:hypothetical protein